MKNTEVNIALITDANKMNDYRSAFEDQIKSLQISGLETKVVAEIKISMIDPSQLHSISKAKLGNIDLGILDISNNVPNTILLLGLLLGAGKPAILIASSEVLDKIHNIIQIVNERIYQYMQIDSLIPLISHELIDHISKIIDMKEDDRVRTLLNEFWFGSQPQYIYLIGPNEAMKTEYASPLSANYIHQHNFGDNDTIVEANSFLKMLYPKATIYRYPADVFPPSLYEENLLIIGGPGDIGIEGNIVCHRMMEKYNAQIRYVEDGEKLAYEGKEYVASFDIDGYLVKDYGYYARLRNPFNKDKIVVLLGGIHTYGVLGASKAFSDHSLSKQNIMKAMTKLNQQKTISFETFFEVPVITGKVLCPEVEIDNLVVIKND